MSQDVGLSGIDGVKLKDALRASLIARRPAVVGIASAFVSTAGVRGVAEVFRRCGEPRCLLISGTDNAVTHPEALYIARERGWRVRIGRSTTGIFHPKLIVAGNAMRRVGAIAKLCCVYVGSSNLTGGGLVRNVECGMLAHDEDCPSSAAAAFLELWRAATPATQVALRNYAARFAEQARRRSVSELTGLGISDIETLHTNTLALLVQSPPLDPALKATFALAAWTGLQSFTGEYRFQVEFPRAAGTVIRQLVGAHAHADGRVDVYVPDDGAVRQMQYRYYTNNGMFRLNIPNDTPGVGWARANRGGIAVVEQGLWGGAPLRLRILKPGDEEREVVGKSVALGTWGKTSTRAYGWY